MSIFGSIGRILFGGSAKSNSTTTANGTTTQSPYAPAIPAINDYLTDVNKLYGGGAPQISPFEQSGYDKLAGTAADSSGLDAAQAENASTISGKYLTPETNPYLADIASRIGADAMQSVNSTFGGHGRTGSGLHGYYAGKGVGDALTDLYGRTYESERGRQEAAVGRAPGLDAARYIAPQALISAGQGISARPFDIATQHGGILSQIAGLGGTTNSNMTSTGKSTGQKETGGILGSFINHLFQ